MPITVPDRDDWFHDEHGLPHAAWDAIEDWIRQWVPKQQWEDAYQQCTRHALNRLAARLGGGYVTVESENFHLLSDLAEDARSRMLSFIEETGSRITRVIGDNGDVERYGKRVVIRFADTDDYYRYISRFYADGAFAESSGMFLSSGGYAHVAFKQSGRPEWDRQILVHELAHNFVAHLPLPPWLNEALAMAFEADIAGRAAEPLTRELAARHRAYWTPMTIQEFWRGESFWDVEGQELAYSLARILLNLIYTEVRPAEGEFRRFLLSAEWADAGAAAAEEHLEIPLENLVAAFLGPGEWGPRPDSWPSRETYGG